MSETIIINDQVIRVHAEGMAWERAARLGDVLSTVSEAFPIISMQAAEFTAGWKQAQVEAIVDENADPEALAIALEAVGEPPTEQLIAVLFPSVWGVARSEILDLLSILTVSDKELFDADDQGGDEAIKARLDEQAKLLKRAQLKDLIQLVTEAIPAVMSQFESVSSALGDASGKVQAKKPAAKKKSPSGPSAAATSAKS
jgi:hypothetical protein